MDAFIYILSDPRTSEIRYVGKTFNVRHRYSRHLNEKRRSHKVHWISQLKSVGLLPQIEVVESFFNCEDDSEWAKAERWWIAYLKFIGCRLLNQDEGGNSGYRKSEETKEKLRSIPRRRGLPSPKKGIKLTEEQKRNRKPRTKGDWHHTEAHKEKMRKLGLGRKRSPESIAKTIAANLGRKASPETLEKLRISHLGKKRTKESIEKAAASLRRAFAEGRTKGRKGIPNKPKEPRSIH